AMTAATLIGERLRAGRIDVRECARGLSGERHAG
ncbi:MAG: adenosylmethionine decarboxylase, partial [Rhodocyclaceae bacterium]|nr:adenosylmethionine decarboxylase [Rhodocyclaceae bacterium]